MQKNELSLQYDEGPQVGTRFMTCSRWRKKGQQLLQISTVLLYRSMMAKAEKQVPMSSGFSHGLPYESIKQPQHDKSRCCQLCRTEGLHAGNVPRGSAIVTRIPWLSVGGKLDAALMVGKFKSFAAFASERPGDIQRGMLSFRQKAVLVTPKSGDGQPEKPRCDIPPGPGARKRYDA